MSKLITCPSGMVLSIRGMKAKEMVHLQDKRTMKNGLVVDKILAACIESVQDSGPYPEMGSQADLDAMLLGDKFYALLMVRAETFGDQLTLGVDCAGGKCGKSYEVAISLAGQPVRKLSADDAATLKSGRLFTCKSPHDGKTVRYRLSTGKDEALSRSAIDDENPALAILALRIDSIEGIETIEEFGQRKLATIQTSEQANRPQHFGGGVRGYLEDLPLDAFYALAEEMEKHECGVELGIETECPKCGTKQKERLSITPNFWKRAKG